MRLILPYTLHGNALLIRHLSLCPYILFALQLFILLAFASSAVAAPKVAVSAESREGSRYVVFTFTQDDLPSMEGCFYNFMASGSAKNLERKNVRARSVATFFKPLPVVKIIAGPLRQLSRQFGHSEQNRKKGVVFFRTLITCYNGEITPAETLSVSFDTAPQGKIPSIDRLIKEIKYNMAYYDGD